ncbi:MAG: GNAT family N-acetyltransferase [Ruminococcaceae bacterium]|nr:GNAT family N-acetyltransferase [Oscillospiraceae bacterium]
MLRFEPFSLSSLQRILPYIKKGMSACSDLSAGALFLWQPDTDLRFCEWNRTLVIRQNVGEQPAFSFPVGEDPDGMIDELLQYVKENHLPLRFFAVDEPTLEKIRQDHRLESPMWAFDPRWSDYVYSFEEAKTFAGRKYSGQRNHINKFKNLYGEPVVRLLQPEDHTAVLELLTAYRAEHTDQNLLEQLELAQTEKLLSVADSLGLYTAGLFVGEKMAAFSIGEVIGETLLIHVEKALRCYVGAYPTMYSGFVRFMDKIPEYALRLVNREDDSGDPGLRTSKMQYHPIRKINKYLVHIHSPAARMPFAPVIHSGGIVLTSFCESDKQAYFALNTDLQNNRYWGYDYREDVSLTGQIDENTFYDSTIFDMNVGDSINFAIRLSENGEMIGEAILWNFSYDGTAELGCRILPQYQRNGYGKTAFKAAAEFAVHSLNLQVTARCDKRNTASCRMIAASGFIPRQENDTYYYFDHQFDYKN